MTATQSVPGTGRPWPADPRLAHRMTTLDRSTMLAVLGQAGMDTSVIPAAVPDEVLEAMLKCIQGLAQPAGRGLPPVVRMGDAGGRRAAQVRNWDASRQFNDECGLTGADALSPMVYEALSHTPLGQARLRQLRKQGR